MAETITGKVYPVIYNTQGVNAQLTNKTKPCVKRARFRRSTIVYNFINFIVKNVYLINDIDDNVDIDINKKID